MAKKQILKRVITKSGQVRYYKNGKRLKSKTGQRNWVKQNRDLAPESFTPNELRSYNALQRYNDSYKFKGVSVQSVYIELLKKMAVPVSLAKNKDLATIKGKDGKPLYKNFSDVLRDIDNRAKSDKKFLQFCTNVGLPGYRNRDIETFRDNKIKSIIDFVDLLDQDSFKNYTLVVLDSQGDEHRGRVKGVLALRDFEIMVGERVQQAAQNSAFLRFCYDYKLNIRDREIIINLTDRKELKDIEDYIETTTAKEGTSLSINDKYSDVTIEIAFS